MVVKTKFHCKLVNKWLQLKSLPAQLKNIHLLAMFVMQALQSIPAMQALEKMQALDPMQALQAFASPKSKIALLILFSSLLTTVGHG